MSFADAESGDERMSRVAELATLGELVAGLAHELNNALIGVLLYSEMLASSEPELEPLLRAAQRASGIVNNLLLSAPGQAMGLVPVDLNEVLTFTVQLKAYNLRISNIGVDMRLSSRLPKVRGDASQLQSLFLNLINNAQHAIYEGPGSGTVRITTARDNDNILATIADNGPGIRPEHLERIFDAFFTTKPLGSGTGLGLSLCRNIIAGHGGRIWAESELGRGATFYVELPIDGDSSNERGCDRNDRVGDGQRTGNR